MLILQFIMLSLHIRFTTVVKGCLSATFDTEYSSWCVLCRGMQVCQAASDQYCPRSILVSPPPAWLHSTRTRAIRSFIALAWGGDLVYNDMYCTFRVWNKNKNMDCDIRSVDCDCWVRRWMETNGCLPAVAGGARNTLDTSLDWAALLWKYDWWRWEIWLGEMRNTSEILVLMRNMIGVDEKYKGHQREHQTGSGSWGKKHTEHIRLLLLV